MSSSLSNSKNASIEETSLDKATGKPSKDPKLSVSEAFGIGERNLHKKDDDEPLERAVADLD
ncbi:hypothetical protein LUX29_02545 [Aureimonas altamirensis]|uniref:hypothetical protein n=1 Tax=Aureimonas altamirensis TaxID=370622 RepID=UPI001E5FE2B2|nr:hypothetical protein [Aureimonas altamirensis]UHD46142.1 hypothetical protein LUX29_02545 [Aureimonas altamirensis]